MLERILNINPQDKYKSGVKIATHTYAVNRNDDERHNSKDSALFSPLAKLLAKINWRILNIEYPSDNEILFSFLVNDFEFSISINLNDLYENAYQEVTIFNINENNGKKIGKKFILKVKKEKISILTKSEPIITDSIELIFDRLKVNKKKNYSSSDSVFLKSLIFGLEGKLHQELKTTIF